MPENNQSIRMQGKFNDIDSTFSTIGEGLMTEPLDPLQLNIEDDELVRIVDEYSSEYNSYYTTKYDLFNRRDKNEIYLFGRQIMQKEKDKLMKNFESRYLDNVLYEIEGTIKPLTMSRIPDLMVLPGHDNDDARLMATEVGKAIDNEIKKYDNRFVLGLASKHFPVYFISVIKAVWDNEIDDYKFVNIHPNLIELDHTVPFKNADNMKYIAELVPATVQDILMRFPKAKDKFLEQLRHDGLLKNGTEPSWALLATELKYREVWFHQYKQKDDGMVERIDGVLWKYKDVILGKMKNPNFDYEGEERYFAFDEMGNNNTKRALNEQELMQILLQGQIPQNVKKERVYHNYFRRPKKPYYFMGYDQWGKQPMDETSRIEQNIQNQESLDRRGKQIEETLDSRGHHILAKGAVSPADLEELDFDEPNVDLSVEGNPNEVYAYIPPERPTPQEFEEKAQLRDRMYAVSHSNAVRGEIKAEAPATSNQIAREGDFTAADDLVEDTINNASQWMAEWALHFIKLRYTVDHFEWIMGVEGKAVYQRLNRNMISDGMIVKIKASGTDRLRAQNNAMEMAKMQMTDPFTFFVDMGLSDPEGRTEKLILAKTDPMAYLSKVVKGLNTSDALAKALINAELPQENPSPVMEQPQPNPAPTMPMAGAPQPQEMPQAPSMGNTSQVPLAPPAGPPQGSPRIL